MVGAGQSPGLASKTAPVVKVWGTPLRRRLTACRVVGNRSAGTRLDSNEVGYVEGAVKLTPLSIKDRKVS